MIIMKRIPWDDLARDHFARIVCEPPLPVDFYREEVERGASLVAVFERDERVGSFLLRGEGPELVVVAAAGSVTEAKPYGDITAVIEREAAAAGYERVRLHAVRPGVERAAAAAGYRKREVVMDKVVSDGR
jgi:hypothetical protein